LREDVACAQIETTEERLVVEGVPEAVLDLLERRNLPAA
jgi:hypothetical protein